MDRQAEFFAAQQAGLLRAAFLLTGSGSAAQDLVQETMVRLLRGWRRVERADLPEAYARRVLLNVYLTGQRRFWRHEVPSALPPDRVEPSADGQRDDLDVLLRALRGLPARQRAAVVLRHYEDRSEMQTAELLGCSTGTVKSLTSRGLAALRVAMIERTP